MKETQESPDQRGRDEEGDVQREPHPAAPAARAHVGFVTRTNLNTKKERQHSAVAKACREAENEK